MHEIMDMDRIVGNWLRQAQADLKSARNSLDSGDYYVSAFMSQQAVEKAMKALTLDAGGELVRTHSTIRLAKNVDAPPGLLEKISLLEPVYQETRYPDVSSKIPAEEYERSDAESFTAVADEVLEWVKRRIR